jgi:hypothetical protein
MAASSQRSKPASRATAGPAADRGGAEPVPTSAGSFQRREWMFQRLGWALLALITLAALAGLFGDGPLANASAGNGRLALDYERFTRSKAETEWRITLKGGEPGRVAVAIDGALASEFKILAIHPEPVQTKVAGLTHVYLFDVADRDSIVEFVVEPQRMGSHESSIRMNGSPPLRIRQFAYP